MTNTGDALIIKSSGSAEPALDFVTAAFEKETGFKVRAYYSEELPVYDLLVASQDAIERKFHPAGKVDIGGAILGSVGFGIAIRSGAPIPEIGDILSFEKSLLETEHLLITENHTSGLYAEEMLKKMGLHHKMTDRLIRCHNGPALMERLLLGTGRECAFLAINALRTYSNKGLTLVGPIPAEVQNMRTFMIAVATGSQKKGIANAFVNYCAHQAKPILAANGFI